MQTSRMAVLEIKTDHYHETQNEWDNRPPVNIACAAIVLSDHDNPLVHTNKQPDGQINDHLTKPQTEDFIRHLLHIRDEGYDLVSWNGTSFDLQTIADVTEMHDQCADLAVDHYDVMFQIFCSIGWPVSLNATALGMGIDHEHTSPADLNEAWKDPERRTEVIHQAIRDAKATIEIAQRAQSTGRLSWYSKSGKLFQLEIENGLLTVDEALTIPEPDTSWMTDPLSRWHFIKWLPEYAPQINVTTCAGS